MGTAVIIVLQYENKQTYTKKAEIKNTFIALRDWRQKIPTSHGNNKLIRDTRYLLSQQRNNTQIAKCQHDKLSLVTVCIIKIYDLRTIKVRVGKKKI